MARGKNSGDTPVNESAQLEMFGHNSVRNYVSRYDTQLSELQSAQAEIRKIKNAATEDGMDKIAMDFVLRLRGKVASDKLTANEALAVVENVQIYADWLFEDQADREAEIGAEVQQDLDAMPA